MKKPIVALFFLGIIIGLVAPWHAQAIYLVDTGEPPNTLGGWDLSWQQSLAAKFTVNQDFTITAIAGWMYPEFALGGTVTAVIYEDDDGGNIPDTSSELFSQSFAVNSWGLDWRGPTGLNWNLSTGAYWIAFEIRGEDTFNGGMRHQPPNPLVDEAYGIPYSYIGRDELDIGVRIQGHATIYKPGDIDHDGTIDLVDVILALQVCSATTTSLEVHLVAEVNGDGKIGTAETIYILQCLAGLHNTAPELDPIGDKEVDEGANLEFSISAFDYEGDDLTFSASDLPDGASFEPNTKTFSWTPYYSQFGLHNVTFTVRDAKNEDSETITITVNDINPTLSVSEFFPLAVGNWWEYKNDYTSEVIRYTIPQTKLVNGALTYVYAYDDGTKRYYTSDANGIKVHGEYIISPEFTGEVLFDTPLLYAPGSCSIGHNEVAQTSYSFWVSGYLFHVDLTSTTTVIGFEDIQTENMTLRDCVKISSRITQYIVELGQTIVGDPLYLWLYKGVGPVKEESIEGNYTIIESNVNGEHLDY